MHRPRVTKIRRASPGYAVAELDNGKFAVGQVRQGAEIPRDAAVFDTYDDASIFFDRKVK